MKNVRLYGKPPYGLALLHGGPGARGSLAGAAAELGRSRGVLEPLQTRLTIDALVQELHEQLRLAQGPVTLAGHSWGAWLALAYAATHPQDVRRLVLISCPPLTEEFVPLIRQNRLALLSPEEADAYLRAEQTALSDCPQRQEAFETLDELTQKTDFFHPCAYDDSALELDARQYQAVWPQAERARREGQWLRAAEKLTCPLTVLHGRQDPHPLQGVLEPLAQCGQAPQVFVLEKCSHSPFAERYARDKFYRLLRSL